MLSTAAITTTWEPNLLTLSPDLNHDLWDFDVSPMLSQRLSILVGSKGWKSREKCPSSFKNWQAFAVENFQDACIDEDDHDPYYDAPLMRSRQEYFSKLESLKENALASENVCSIWA